MRVNQRALAPGESTSIGDHAVAIASDGEAGITFGKAAPTTGEAARINAALASVAGFRVSKYWKSGAMAVQVPAAPGHRSPRVTITPGLTVSSKGQTVAANATATPGVVATGPCGASCPLCADPLNADACARNTAHAGDHKDNLGHAWPVEPEPTAPLAGIQQGSQTGYIYTTWANNTVSIGGSGATGRAVLGLRSMPDMAEQRRLNVALAGWGVAFVDHPRTKVRKIKIEPAIGSDGRTLYRDLQTGQSYYGRWQPEPAGAQPFAGLGGVIARPVCKATTGGFGSECQRWPAHEGMHKDAYGRTWATPNAQPPVRDAMPEATEDEPTVAEPEPDADLPVGAHVYVPQPGLIDRWDAGLAAMAKGKTGRNFLFIGPSGSGKGDGAAFLAARSGLAFTKIDAASVTEPEAWFGTREVEDHDGTPVTSYRPSLLVQSVQQPGVTFVDEITRARTVIHNIFLPLLDGTRKVTNPLNGEVITRHPENIIIMAANRGLEYTGTFDLDPALTSRVRTIRFGYPPAHVETRILEQASGCDKAVAALIVRFANETRAKAKQLGIPPMSVREAISAAEDAANGLALTAAIDMAYIAVRDDEGGAQSPMQAIRDLWTAIGGDQ